MHSDQRLMARAIELAARGEGAVEPNPMVGCVIAAADGTVIGEGWHERFGGPHAEVNALADAGDAARGATMFVTLEPCSHQGKTPPCSQAVIAAGLSRVVVGLQDPYPAVDGGGLAELQAAGIEVTSGVLENEVRTLCAPYLKLVETGRCWVLAKWAMTLDGKIATATGESQWISSEASRAVVHRIRGRMDAIIVGRRTAELDDPLLTARPPGLRTAARIALDSQARLALNSQLVQTAGDSPVIVATSEDADARRCESLQAAGCEVLPCTGATPAERLAQLFDTLGSRRMTNVMVEGGGEVLGSLLDAGLADELHVFIAPKVIGGAGAPGPVAGRGAEQLTDALQLASLDVQQLDSDVYLRGRIGG